MQLLRPVYGYRNILAAFYFYDIGLAMQVRQYRVAEESQLTIGSWLRNLSLSDLLVLLYM